MGNKQSTTPRGVWNKFLIRLNTSWARYTAIFAIIMGAFKAGCYYQEGVLSHAHLEFDRQREDYWREQMLQWQREQKELLDKVYVLREQNLQLLEHNTDSVTIQRPINDEK